MEIVVLVFGIVGFVMSWVIIGAVPAAIAILLGPIRLLIKKKPLRKLGKIEILIGMFFAFLAIGISIYVYFAHIMDIDFVLIIKERIAAVIWYIRHIKDLL